MLGYPNAKTRASGKLLQSGLFYVFGAGLGGGWCSQTETNTSLQYVLFSLTVTDTKIYSPQTWLQFKLHNLVRF